MWTKVRPPDALLCNPPQGLDPETWPWWPTYGQGKLRIICFYHHNRSLASLFLVPHLGPVCHGWPCRGHKAQDSFAPRNIGTSKPLHHDKAIGQEGWLTILVDKPAFCFLTNIICTIWLRFKDWNFHFHRKNKYGGSRFFCFCYHESWVSKIYPVEADWVNVRNMQR